eukprot:439282-Amphidinium_carterae.1
MLSWRFGSEAWLHHVGVGMALFGVRGRVVVLAVSMEAVHKAGGCATQLTAHLDNMSGGDCTEFMANHSRYFVLGEGDAAYVPWGYHMSLVTVSERSATMALPWYHVALRSRLPDLVCKELKDIHET